MNSRNIFSISFLIIALSIAYYFVIFIPKKEQAKQDSEYQIQMLKLKSENEKKQVYEICDKEAIREATSLLKEKAELAKGTAQGDFYSQASEKDLYLKDDYKELQDRCLMRNGIDIR